MELKGGHHRQSRYNYGGQLEFAPANGLSIIGNQDAEFCFLVIPHKIARMIYSTHGLFHPVLQRFSSGGD